MKKLIYIIFCAVFPLSSAFSQATCSGTGTFQNAGLATYSSSTVFGDGTTGYVTVCIESGTIGTGMCGGNNEGIVIRESDGTILAIVTAGTTLPACYTSTVNDGTMNVSNLCGTGLSNIVISWSTGDSPTGGGVDQCDHCLNGIQDEDETNVDCGGADCLPCGPAHCYNGVIDAGLGETDVDCGGPCNGYGGTACCTNGYLDYNEFAIDCGSSCGAPANDVCSGAIPLTSTGGSGCNYNATEDGVPASWAPDAGNGPMDFSTVCSLNNIDAGTFRWVSHNNGVWYTITTTTTQNFVLDITNISCTGNGVIKVGLWSNGTADCNMDNETLMGCAMTDQVDMTLTINNLPAGNYMLFVDGADGSQCYWDFVGSILPVKALNLQYELMGEAEHVILKVSNTESKAASHYVIEKSLDGSNFSYLSKIEAQGKSYYEYIDRSGAVSVVYYRVKEYSADNKVLSTSKVSRVTRRGKGDVSVLRDGNNITLVMSFPAGVKETQMTVIDNAGRQVYTELIDSSKGHNSVKLNTAILGRGLYHIIISGSGMETPLREKIIIQ